MRANHVPLLPSPLFIIIAVVTRFASYKKYRTRTRTTFRESKGSKPILLYLEAFKKLGLEKEIEPVIDALWKIFGDLQPYVYPEPRRYDWPFKYGEDDWRKLASLLRRHEKSTASRQDLNKYSQN